MGGKDAFPIEPDNNESNDGQQHPANTVYQADNGVEKRFLVGYHVGICGIVSFIIHRYFIALIHAAVAAIHGLMFLMSMVLVSYSMIVMGACGFKTAAFSFGNVTDIPFGRLTVYNVLMV